MDIEEIYDMLSSIQMGMRDKRNLAQLLFNGLDGQGTTDYNKLVNKPSINNVPLKGNLTLDKLGLTNLIKAIDTLTSTDKINALSANQGRILNNKITELVNTLTSIRTDLENKADSATTLAGYGITNAYTKQEVINAINEAIAGLGGSDYVKEIYKLNTSSFNTSTYQTLLNAVNSNKIIIINDSFLAINKQILGNTIYICSMIIDNTNTTLNAMFGTFIFNSNGTQDMKEYVLELRKDGTGNKFLNDKGEYVTIDPGTAVDATGIILTQAQFDALETYQNAVYFIKG